MTGIETAKTLIVEGRRDEALVLLESLGRAPQTRHDALGNRAWLLRSMGRYEEAAADYRAILAEWPDDVEAESWLGDLEIRLGHEAEGVERLMGLLRRDPLLVRPLDVLRGWQASRGAVEPAGRASIPNPVQAPAPNPVLAAMEGDPASYPGSVFPEIGRIIYALVRLLRPRIALETGTFKGYSSICIAQAMKDNGHGHLHAFDLFMPHPGYVSPVLGPCEDGIQVVRGHLEHAGVASLVTLHPGDSSSTIRRDLEGIVGKLDFAFIDGDHTLAGCIKDWNEVDRLLAVGGVVLLHDTEPEMCSWMGPRYLIEKLGKRGARRYHTINLPSPEGFGLALVQKKDPRGYSAAVPSRLELLHERLFESRLRRQGIYH